MATNRRDVELGIAVKTAGAEEITNLANSIQQLAQQGGAAGPEFERLAVEIKKISSDVGAVSTFANLREEIQKLGTAQEQAKAKAGPLAAQYKELGDAARNAAAAASAAEKVERDSKVAYDEKRVSLAKLKVETDDAAKKQAEYKADVKSLSLEIIDLKKAYDGAKVATKEASLEATKAANAQTDLKAAYKSSQIALEQSNTALAKRAEAFKSAEADIAKAGVATDDLAGAEQRLRSALSAASDYAKILQADIVSLARAESELANSNAFDKQVADAKRLREAADYVRFWATSLDEAEAAGRLFGQDEGIAKKARDARLLRGAADDVQAFTHELSAAERAEVALLNTQAFDKKVAEAARLREGADYVRFWTAELGKAEAAEKQLAEQSQRAAQALNNAFSSLGIRSITAIKTEIETVNASLLALARDSKVSGAEFDRAFKAGQERVNALNKELTTTPGQLEKSGVAARFLRDSLGQLAAIYGGIELSTKFFEANQQIETLRRTLTLVTGSSAVAADQIKLLRDTANNAGQSVGLLAQDFSTFTAAVTASGISLEQANATFTTVANAAGQLGLSTQRTGLILTALGQVASKGKVSLEELQGQLGESLPGALAITAKGLGVTTERLVSLVSTGELAAKDFFPAFTYGLEQTFGNGQKQVEGLFAAFNRAKNALTELSQSAADSTAFKALASTLDFAAKNMVVLADTAYGLGKAFVALKAIDYVSSLLGISTAANRAKIEQAALTVATEQAAVAKTADTVATNTNTVATNANTVAKKANALALGEIALGSGYAGTKAAEATAKVGALAGAFGAVRGAGAAAFAAIGGLPALLLLVAVNAQELGTWLGETVAKLMGADKASKDFAEKLRLQAQAQKLASNEAMAAKLSYGEFEKATLGITDASSKLVDAFVKVVKDGGNVNEALDKLTKHFDAGNRQSILDTAVALDTLAQRGKISADEVQKAWSMALSGTDLGVFLTNAQTVFDKTDAGVRKLQATIDATLTEAIKRSGLEFRELETGVNKAMMSAINDTDMLIDNLEKLKSQGLDTGRLLAASLDKALEAAKTEQAVKLVIERIEDMGAKGEIAGQRFTDSLDKAKTKLDEVKLGVNSIDEAFKTLGLSSQTELLRMQQNSKQAWEQIKNDATVSITRKQEAFAAYADKVMKGNDEVAKKIVEVERAYYGVDGAAKKASDTMADGARRSAEQLYVVRDVLGEVYFKTQAAADAAAKYIDTYGSLQSVLANNKYDKDKFALDSSGNRLTMGNQLKIPDGYFFDAEAANKDPRFRNARSDGSEFIKPTAATQAAQQAQWDANLAAKGGPKFNGGRGTPLLGGSTGTGTSSRAVGTPAAGYGTGSSGSYTVNINMGGSKTSINAASASDAQRLTEFLQSLESAARGAGG